DGELCALVQMVVEPDCLLIENLAVSPEHQGKRLGSTLVRHAESQARALGLSTVRLYTNRAFGSNVEFYERHGFRIEREEPFMGGLTIYMRKPVGEP
ncbi:MAG: GNAT family N-acetyltransferase, partial [Pseudomonadota bacterium]